MRKQWFVHGFSGKDGDIAYVVEASGRKGALKRVAGLMGRSLVFHESGCYLHSNPDAGPGDIGAELESNLGSPRRSYRVTALPLRRNVNLL